MKIQKFDHLTAIHVEQALNRTTAENLSYLIATASQFSPRLIVLDMSDVSYATVFALKHLLINYQKYRAQNLRIAINRMNEPVDALLSMAGFWLVFERFDDDLQNIDASLDTSNA